MRFLLLIMLMACGSDSSDSIQETPAISSSKTTEATSKTTESLQTRKPMHVRNPLEASLIQVAARPMVELLRYALARRKNSWNISCSILLVG